MSRLLINESPLQVLPSLATAIGLNEAIVLQQIHYWLSTPGVGVVVEGCRWVHNTLAAWHAQFPFWSKKTVERTLERLRESGLVEAKNLSNDPFNKTLSYRINRRQLAAIENDILSSSDQTDCRAPDFDNLTSSETPDCRKLYITETTKPIDKTTYIAHPDSGEPPPASNPAGTKRRKVEPNPLNVETWDAYATAYRKRYRADPLRNAKTNAQIASIGKLAGAEAPKLVAFFLTHEDPYFVRERHAIGVLLASVQRVWVDMQTGTTQSTKHPAPENFATKNYGVTRPI